MSDPAPSRGWVALIPFAHLALGALVAHALRDRWPGEPAMVALALALWVAPAWLWAVRQAPLGAPPVRREWLWLGGIVLAGAALRSYDLDGSPAGVDYDAAQAALLGTQLIEEGRVVSVAGTIVLGVETAFFYAVGATLKVLGVSVWALRVPAVVTGTLTIPAVHVFARAIGGPRVALLAASAVALSPAAAEMSRASKHSLLVAPVLALAFASLLGALKHGGAWRYLVAGAWAGLGMHTYPSYRHAIPCSLVALFLAARPGPGETRAARPGPWVGGLLLLVGALVAAAGVLADIARDPWGWLEPIARNHADGGDLAGLAAQALTVGLHAVAVAPTIELGAASALGLAALAALPLVRGLGARGRVVVWLVLAMAAPAAFARYHVFVPRRFIGMLPVWAVLAGLGIDRALAGLERTGSRALVRGGWAALALMAIGLGSASLARLDSRLHGEPQLEREAMLRAALVLAAERDVYVAADTDEGDYRALFFLLHPHVHTLVDNDPLGVPPGTRDLAFIGPAGLGARVLALCPEAEEIPLELAPDVAVPAWTLARADLERRRLGRIALTGTGFLVAPRDGRYLVAVAPGTAGALSIDGAVVVSGDAPPGPRRELVLARGAHRYEVRGAVAPFDVLARSATGPDAALEAWRLGAGSDGQAAELAPEACVPEIVEERVAFVRGPERRLDGEGLIDKHRDFQDVAALADGTVFVAGIDGVTRLLDDFGVDPDFAGLRDREGKAIGAEFSYDYDPPKQWSLAAAPDGTLVVACRRGAWVRRFDRDGACVAELEADLPWEEPVDVAVALDGRVAVAEWAQRRVVVLGPTGDLVDEVPQRLPIAVAWRGNELALIDGERLELVAIADFGAEPARRAIGVASQRCRLVGAPGGRLLVVEPGRVRLFDASLRLVAPMGDPNGPHVATAGAPPLVGADVAGSSLYVLDRAGHLERYDVAGR